MEQGWWSESMKQARIVLQCHTAGKRESLDMMGKAFEFGNYNKALDLSEFAHNAAKYVPLSHLALLPCHCLLYLINY